MPRGSGMTLTSLGIRTRLCFIRHARSSFEPRESRATIYTP
jgi:hypothetical protein